MSSVSSDAESDAQIKKKVRRNSDISSHSMSTRKSTSPSPSKSNTGVEKREEKGGGGGGRKRKNAQKKLKTKKQKTCSPMADEEYLVEEILDKKYDDDDGVYKYFIKWIGWPSSTNTWEPLEHLNGCDEMLRMFEERWEKAEAEKKESKMKASTMTNKENRKSKEESDDSENKPLITDEVESENLELMSVIPPDKIPRKLAGVVTMKGSLVYIVEWEGGENDLDLVGSKVFAASYPALVISFYETRIKWTRDKKTKELALKLNFKLKKEQPPKNPKTTHVMKKMVYSSESE